MTTCVKNSAKEVIDETKRSIQNNKKRSCIVGYEEIQKLVGSKIKQFKIWQKNRNKED